MGRFCCVPGCVSRKKKIKVSYYSIPSPVNNRGVEDKIKRRRHEAWIKAIGRPDITKLVHASVCSVHFIRGRPSAEEYDTHPDWVPSLYLKSQVVNEKKYNRSIKKMEQFIQEKNKERRSLLQSLAEEQEELLKSVGITLKPVDYTLLNQANTGILAEEVCFTPPSEEEENCETILGI